MTSDSGLTSQDTDYARHIQEVLNELRQMQQTPRLVTSPEELEALEREIRQRTDRLGSLLVGHHLQQALDSAALQAEQEQLVRQWPKPLKNDGKVTGEGAHGARAGRAGAGDLLPPQGPEASGQALRGCVCRPGAVRDLRSLHPGVGCRGESVGRDVGLFGRGPGRVGRPGAWRWIRKRCG